MKTFRDLKEKTFRYDIFGGGSGSTAPQRNLTQELEQTLQGYQNTAPGFLALNQQFQPQYDQLNLNEAALQQRGYTDASGVYHPGTLKLGQQANTSNRGAALTDLAGLGPSATALLLNSNPFLADALGGLSRTANEGPSPLLGQLNKSAGSLLAQNGRLSPQETRDLSQGAASIYAGRGGVPGSNSQLATDLFSRDSATTAKRAAAEQFAGSVQGLNTTQQGLQGQLFGNYGNLASSTLSNPILQLLGFGNLNPGYSGSATNGGSGSSIANANNLFPSFNSYINDIYSSNQNATASQNIANQNNSTATTLGILSLLGSAAGAAFSDERLKKRIKKTGRKTPEGLDEITWVYKTDPKKRTYVGVSAQEAEKKAPWAVLTDPISGIKAVDYGRLGISMHELIAGGQMAEVRGQKGN